MTLTKAKKTDGERQSPESRLLTAFEAGRDVYFKSILKHELLPVLAEMDGMLRTGN
jgi:hypothetical protein